MSENKVAYVVTCGDYSDYRIVGVFSSKALAQTHIDAFDNSYDGCKIEEYPIDATEEWGYITTIYMKRNGNSSGGHTERQHRPCASHKLVSVSLCGKKKYLESRVLTDSMERAVKVTNEHRVRLIASGQWPSSQLVV